MRLIPPGRSPSTSAIHTVSVQITPSNSPSPAADAISSTTRELVGTSGEKFAAHMVVRPPNDPYRAATSGGTGTGSTMGTSPVGSSDRNSIAPSLASSTP